MWRDNFTHAGKRYPICSDTSVCDSYGRMYAANTLKPCRPSGISFLICFVTYIAAAYFPIEWLVGNGAMVMRYQLFDANGLSYRKELVFTLLLLLLSIGAGYLLIQRKDLISLEK